MPVYETPNQGPEPKLPNAEPAAVGGKTEKIEQDIMNGALVFNVMPPTNSSGAVLVEPKINTQQAPVQPLSLPTDSSFLAKNKLYVILAIIVIIGAPVAYFLVPKIMGDPYEGEEIELADSTPKPPPPLPEAPPPLPEENFTTPKAWRDQYFPSCWDIKTCGDNEDPDNDGLSNTEERKLQTEPTSADSDDDGLADGDEVKVFLSNPLSNHTTKNLNYVDPDYIKGGYSFVTDKKFTTKELNDLSAKMKSIGLHEPTISTIGSILSSKYKWAPQTATTTPESLNPTPPPPAATTTPEGFDPSLSAKQDRDTRRSNAIKNMGTALIAYFEDKNSYPNTPDFSKMYAEVKPYIKVATNPADPINQAPFVYGYAIKADGTDFTLSFYSEVADAIIKKTSADAKAEAEAAAAAINDNQRMMDLESLRVALLLYSQSNAAGGQDYVFPAADKYKTELVPEFIGSIPTDPVSKQDYAYEVAQNFDAFTLKTTLQAPPVGNTGYMCNQLDDCNYY